MPLNNNISTAYFWRTWFLEECEENMLFGVPKWPIRQLSNDAEGFKVFSSGTEFYLEDAPYNYRIKSHHRLCGPYIVVPSVLPKDGNIVIENDGKVIMFLEAHPSRGPWLDHSKVKKRIEKVEIIFPQKASKYGFYPYRFSFNRSPQFAIKLISHDEMAIKQINNYMINV